VFAAALSVWHLHDWVWHECNPEENSGISAFKIYQGGLLAACPELKSLRGVADAGKHRGLNRSTTVRVGDPEMVHRGSTEG